MRNDLTGKRFHSLTVLRPTPERRESCVLWLCRCDCGAEKAIPTTDLTRGRVKSCGCLRHRAKDITGERRGHLVAIGATGERDAKGHAIYRWRCDCGNEFERSINGTARDTARLCPACRRAVKAGQIDLARRQREFDAATGLTRKYLLNIRNGVPTARNTSGVRGVYWHEGHQSWVASGRQNGRPVTLGEFDNLAEAREARERFVRKNYGPAVRAIGSEAT